MTYWWRLLLCFLFISREALFPQYWRGGTVEITNQPIKNCHIIWLGLNVILFSKYIRCSSILIFLRTDEEHLIFKGKFHSSLSNSVHFRGILCRHYIFTGMFQIIALIMCYPYCILKSTMTRFMYSA